MKTVKVQYAKTHLSALIAAAESGEEVIIARGNQPVARLLPLAPAGERELGFVAYRVPDAFFEPLPANELAEWDR